jgi:hypothetical protein
MVNAVTTYATLRNVRKTPSRRRHRPATTASGATSEAEQYRQALAEAFTFRVNWNGGDATPTFSGLGA